MNYQRDKIQQMNVTTLFQYRGCLVEKIIGGYRVFNKKVTSMDDVDDVIDESIRTVGKSIVRVENKNDGVINVQNYGKD